ncbi:MAG: bifunctional phosphoribosylaminoimidazolecarboxamide formyltransferase/IMP cyclohydrolase [Ignavibacteria bacterium]|nr:bifunctional phosphoribosylaminoimidazolecarboxamide formyltransferase/IMP cyclohydrolase [Ignavibacteria bacterium]MBK7575935.1 bifunctional phosphoribosylaminoimidazolecarboxamide formyltransferase/IMP cyclohydrolase [Ignavibacteria bacterium]
MTALLSVSDKTGILELARELHGLGVRIISTGGTAKAIADAGIPVTKVADITGFPEIMDGRVKTLHPKIHGGLLAVMDDEEHLRQMHEHGIEKIDLVFVNLYPFEQTVAREGASYDEIIENIDIGGPAMVRASAKNHRFTTIVVNPAHYNTVIDHLRSNNEVPLSFRQQLAMEAYSHTAHYDACISEYFAKHLHSGFLSETAVPLRADQHLRYGENPHQTAMLYGSFTTIFRQLHGKELSYNNILDIDAASKLCLEFDEPTVVIVKHNNPCGVGSGNDLVDAYRKAFATDTVSPFGGIIAVNRTVDLAYANEVHSLFAEVIIAPSFDEDALAVLTKKKDRRLMVVDTAKLRSSLAMDLRSVAGGYLAQHTDSILFNEADLRVVTAQTPTDEQRQAMLYAWKIAKHVKSNAIVYASHDRSLAIGAGQMSRIDSARIAVRKAQDASIDLTGCAVASDAFFPFADGLLQAAEAGASCVIQPGGSVRDEEVIAAANEKGLSMMFTGTRHFRH